MRVIHASGRASKTEPPPRLNPPTPAADHITAEERCQQTIWRRHAGALSAFLERPTAENEVRVRVTGAAWITGYLGNGEDGQRARHSLDRRIRKVRFPLLVSRVHALGPRATGELLTEVAGNDAQLADDIFTLLERYAALSPAMVEAVGADDYPPAPLHVAAE